MCFAASTRGQRFSPSPRSCWIPWLCHWLVAVRNINHIIRTPRCGFTGTLNVPRFSKCCDLLISSSLQAVERFNLRLSNCSPKLQKTGSSSLQLWLLKITHIVFKGVPTAIVGCNFVWFCPWTNLSWKNPVFLHDLSTSWWGNQLLH